MFNRKDQKKFDDTMDYVEDFGDRIGNLIHKKGSWIIKSIVITLAIIFVGGGILVTTIIRKSAGVKE